MKPIHLFEPISKYFKWHDALWMPKFNRPALEKDGLNDDILNRLSGLFLIADQVVEFFDRPLVVHVAYRSEAYNTLIGGAPHSAHRAQKGTEAAFDFHVLGKDCLAAQKMILEEGCLDRWGMRMENNGDAKWIHLDTREPLPGHPRYFLP